MLSDRDSLLDEGVKVLRERGSETVHLEDTEDLVTSDAANLSDTVGVTKDNADLRWGHALSCELEDVLQGRTPR